MNGDKLPNSILTFHLRRRTPDSFLLVPCPRIGRAIRCQGQLEAAVATILANCPLVTSIQEQPLQIWYAWRETSAGPQIQLLNKPPRKRRLVDSSVSYVVPDFLVCMTNRSMRLVEVKPSSQLNRPIVQRKLAVARAYARQQGWEYHVLTERELLNRPLLRNLRLLARYRQAQKDSKLANRLVEFVANQKSQPAMLAQFAMTIRGISDSEHRLTLFHLLAVGRLDCNPAAGPIDDSTALYSGGTQPWDPFDSAWGLSGCGREDLSASSVNSPPDGSSSGM
ncbi:TnsA endonuclease N-terminal domain-containing protein [Planctomicrobium sp. SH527]|uniref:TnsA endonuclease N-terminal domain-containing protein n=1 Tax=Planctomicrobium sp. SH527 TaxID=3448123 RepID=UPI003F5BCA15